MDEAEDEDRANERENIVLDKFIEEVRKMSLLKK